MNDATNENWGTEPWRRPTIPEGAEVIFSEPGRSINNVDHRAHWFVLAKGKYGGLDLLVKHGGGEEALHIISQNLFPNFAALAPDDRYLALYALYDLHRKGREKGLQEERAQWLAAVRENRVRRRKMPGRDVYKVWIEAAAPVPTPTAFPATTSSV